MNKIINKLKCNNRLKHQESYSPVPYIKKGKKVPNELFSIPKFYEYNNIITFNYNTKQLKKILKQYKQPVSGNKEILIYKCYNFLKLSFFCQKIQKKFRYYIFRKYVYISGAGYKNYSLCTNQTDFLTLEKLETIKKRNFFSFQDEDKFIYGFQFSSIYNLLIKEAHPKNPYNRNPFPKNILENIKIKIRYSKLLNLDIEKNIDEDKDLANKLKFRVIAAFHKMDELGNYTNAEWFMKLEKFELIKFLREILDIWQYRAQLTNEIKRRICPPIGDPFYGFKIGGFINKTTNYIKKKSICIIENFINKGIDDHAKCLGAFYVLGALTLVSRDAASALPWLYESMRHNNSNVTPAL